MRFPIAWRLGVTLALVGVLGAALTGYLAYRTRHDMLVEDSKQRLLTATRVLMRQVIVALNGTAADVRLLAEHPQAVRILERSDPAFQATTERNVAQLFERMLKVHSEYFQMRLIEADNHGLERLRVDRDIDGILHIEGDDLQEKGHFPYVFETLGLPPGSMYVSRATINHESGAHAGEERPALQVAAPVHDRNGKALGLFVINVDLNGLFAQLAADLPPDLQLYLVNRTGDFLIHPDPARSFAFDRGQSALVQEEFPDVAALLAGRPSRADSVITVRASPRDPSGGRVAAFVHQPLPGMEAEDDFILGLAQPLANLQAESRRLATETWGIVLGYSALALLLAILLALAFSRPLHQVITAVRRFAADGTSEKLPLARRDEIGELARSIDHMQRQIRNQLDDLRVQQDKLDHMASHDSLTGLPNRRLFLDRLEQALARAKRQETQLALLFIDLDNFKVINDRHGHAAGDAVLCAVAGRLLGLLREADTVARLGGDEFIILVEGPCDDTATKPLADKVQAALSEPISYQETELESGGSIGIACYPQDGKTASVLVAAADQAMYRCKNEGR